MLLCDLVSHPHLKKSGAWESARIRALHISAELSFLFFNKLKAKG